MPQKVFGENILTDINRNELEYDRKPFCHSNKLAKRPFADIDVAGLLWVNVLIWSSQKPEKTGKLPNAYEAHSKSK
jgi:hypothetical protein